MLARRKQTLLPVALVALLLTTFAAHLPTQADTGSQPRVLILPFSLNAAGDAERDLREFKDHVDKRLRQVIGMLGESVQTETEDATRLILQSRDPVKTDQDAIWVATESGADLVIFGGVSKEAAGYRMKGTLWDLRQGRASVSIDLQVPNIHGLPGILEVFAGNVAKRIHGSPHLPLYKSGPPAPTEGRPADRLHALANLPQHTGPWRSPDISAAFKGLDIGDMDGDKRNEIVFVEDSTVTISRFEDGGLRTLAQFSEPPATFIAAQVEDVDDDGIAELLLCYRGSRGVESAIARYVNRHFRVVARLPQVILAAIPDGADEKRKMLVGQRTDVKDIFSGEMIRFRLEGNEATPEGSVPLPPGTFLLSYAAGRLGKPSNALRVILSQDQRLMVFDQENRLLSHLTDQLFGSDVSVRISGKD
ncbi:MAG: VCBS repeat-containing protein, partial [Desulfomonile sp.]|nr:VCBS repeat-containing protein [Desulfomonile sp.]